MKIRALEEIIEEYVNTCLKSDESLETGDYKTGNKCYKVIQKIRNELKSNTDYGIEKLEYLLGHPNEYVRLTTAVSFLPINPQKAEEVLSEISSKRGLNAFTAKMTLEEWHKGNIKFD
jgi:hypothetical protein